MMVADDIKKLDKFLVDRYNILACDWLEDGLTVEFKDCNDFTDFEAIKEMGFKIFFQDGDFIAFRRRI